MFSQSAEFSRGATGHSENMTRRAAGESPLARIATTTRTWRSGRFRSPVPRDGARGRSPQVVFNDRSRHALESGRIYRPRMVPPGEVRAKKKSCGQGKCGEWLVSHDEFVRLRNEGADNAKTGLDGRRSVVRRGCRHRGIAAWSRGPIGLGMDAPRRSSWLRRRDRAASGRQGRSAGAGRARGVMRAWAVVSGTCRGGASVRHFGV